MGKVVYGLSGESNEYAFRFEVAEASPSSSVHLFLQRLGSTCSWTTCFSIATLTNTLEEQGVCADESRVRDWVIKAVQHHLLVTCSPNGSGETFASCVHHQPPYKFIIRFPPQGKLEQLDQSESSARLAELVRELVPLASLRGSAGPSHDPVAMDADQAPRVADKAGDMWRSVYECGAAGGTSLLRKSSLESVREDEDMQNDEPLASDSKNEAAVQASTTSSSDSSGVKRLAPTVASSRRGAAQRSGTKIAKARD
mmetsp:Transcript_46514/g.88811  ORF Transcript_46514/g.88811 Transcript_46514/m.88811 type:complete len:255 (+) Transcript_46514:356-1120(+)|eukprot:CAMPEP_0114233902 /NCGR_PEP_ID=MMETSP0058-20121206/5428_1 /TAXON_ID=36894 /ORGANISM="Pyramimonas parkeae, CCMP726" /LENGTH=254 /DNA_ID=CAMNT_0001345555 /DNA_START=298 /DNA_END=1062 /DNA_ORIENTATION=+